MQKSSDSGSYAQESLEQETEYEEIGEWARGDEVIHPDKFDYDVGAIVVVVSSVEDGVRAERIERLTRTMVILTTGEKFKRHNGRQAGEYSSEAKWIQEHRNSETN